MFSCNKNKKLNDPETNSSDSTSVYLSLAGNEKTLEAKRQLYFEKAYNSVINQKNDSITRDNLYKITLGFYKARNWRNFKYSSHQRFPI